MYGFKRVWFLVVVGLLAFASRTSATIIFQDDFQSDSATSCANNTVDTDPAIGTSDVGGSWTAYEPTGTTRFINVVNDAVPYASPYVAGSNNYLKVKRNDTASPTPRAWQSVSSAAATLNTVVNDSFDFRLRTDGTTADPPQSGIVAFYNSGVDTFSNGLFQLLFNLDGSMSYYDYGDDSTHNLTTTHAPDAWNNVSIAMNTSAQTFTVTVGTGSDTTGSWGGAQHQFQTSVFMQSGPACEYFVDNVTTTVPTLEPEPGSLVLVATGVLALLAYAWRRRR